MTEPAMPPATVAVAPSVDPYLARRGGLIAWGVVFIVIGTLAALGMLGLIFSAYTELQTVLLSSPNARPRPAAARGPSLAGLTGVGVTIILLAAAALIWTGIASCLGRRWVRPVVIVGAVAAAILSLHELAIELLMLPVLLERVDAANQPGRGRPGPTSMSVMMAFGLRAAVVFVLGVLLPWLAYRFYASPRTEAALAAAEPRDAPGPLEVRPIPLLAWIALVAAFGISLLLAAIFDPAIPAFIVRIGQAPGIIACSVLGLLLLWSAWLCWRRDRAGWIVSFVVLCLLRVSLITFYLTGGKPADLVTVPTTTPELPIPTWLPAAAAIAELIFIVTLGLFASRSFGRQYRVALVRTAA